MVNKESVKNFLSTIWIFHGRLDRKSYYKRIVFLLLVLYFAYYFIWYFGELEKLNIADMDSAFTWMENFLAMYGFTGWFALILLSGIWNYCVFFGLIALQRRRLNDIGLSGFWVVFVMIACIMLWQENYGNLLPYIQIVWSLFLGLKPGTDGENKYGPDPLHQSVTGYNAI